MTYESQQNLFFFFRLDSRGAGASRQPDYYYDVISTRVYVNQSRPSPPSFAQGVQGVCWTHLLGTIGTEYSALILCVHGDANDCEVDLWDRGGKGASTMLSYLK